MGIDDRGIAVLHDTKSAIGDCANLDAGDTCACHSSIGGSGMTASAGNVPYPTPVLEFGDVSVQVRNERSRSLPILDSISLRIEHGETVGIVGGSGSGKSTLLRLAAGVLSADLVLVHGRVSTVGTNLLGAEIGRAHV